jgi:toxin HigB-1
MVQFRDDPEPAHINRQWRVCFRWTPDGPEAVEIVDYH